MSFSCASQILFVFVALVALSTRTFSHGEEGCTSLARLDVLYLQDDTRSFMPHASAIRSQMPVLFPMLETKFKGSHFGYGLFSDSKRPAGAPDDAYCFRVISSISSSYSRITTNLTLKYDPRQGDNERAEDSLSAMAVAALDPTIEWRGTAISPGDRQFTIPILLVVTDALFQYSGPPIPGLAGAAGSPCRGHRPVSNTTFSSKYECTQDDYVTLAQAKSALEARGAVPVIVTAPDTVEGWRILLNYLDRGGTVVEIPDSLYEAEGNGVAEAIAKGVTDAVCEAGKTTTPIPPYLLSPKPFVIAGAAFGAAVAIAAIGYGGWKYYNNSSHKESKSEEQVNEEEQSYPISEHGANSLSDHHILSLAEEDEYM